MNESNGEGASWQVLRHSGRSGQIARVAGRVER